MVLLPVWLKAEATVTTQLPTLTSRTRVSCWPTNEGMASVRVSAPAVVRAHTPERVTGMALVELPGSAMATPVMRG